MIKKGGEEKKAMVALLVFIMSALVTVTFSEIRLDLYSAKTI